MVDNPAPAVLRVSDVAAVLDMGERQVREAIKLGQIKGCHKIGGQIRCSTVAFKRWLDGEEPNGRTEGGVHGLEIVRAEPETNNGSGLTSPAAVIASR